MAKFLANGVNIHINTRIVSLNYQGTLQLKDEKDQQYSGFNWVVCIASSSRAAELLPEFFKYHADIKTMEMRAYFSLMFGFEQSLPIEFEAAHLTNADLSWIVLNNHKPQRPDLITLMVHSSEEYAEEHIDDDRNQVMQHLIAETSRTIECNLSIADYKTIHSWRCANNADKKQKETSCIDQDFKLATCVATGGLGERVEGAFTSAYKLTKHVKESAL